MYNEYKKKELVLKVTKTEQLNNLFERWSAEKPCNIFMKDGIVCEENYEGVLYILKDVNNAKPDELNDMRIDVQESCDGGRTWFNVARWTSALLDGKSFEQFEYDKKLAYGKDDHTFQHVQMRRAAVVNLKKEAGKSCANDNEINRFACEHKEYLREEIEICDPKMIVVCGVGIFKGAKNVLGNLVPIQKERPKFELAQNWEIATATLNGKTFPVVQFRHPSTGCNKEKSYNDMLKIRDFIADL